MPLRTVTLSDKYDLTKDRVLISGTQAIVRLALAQHARDVRAGLNTAGYVTGYRGSPLGGVDLQFWRAEKELHEAGIVFKPGLNEDLAATAIWGTQQAEMRGEGRYDGVFGIWYGKGPGVDRSGDVFRHANLAGTSKHGGVLALMGDDHTCESSTVAQQSEFAFLDAMMPILNPAGVQEMLDYGLYGYALSRFAGVWVGLKCIKDNVESTASVDGSFDRIDIRLPSVELPPPSLNSGSLNITPDFNALALEEVLHAYRRPAAVAFIRENKLNQITVTGGPSAWMGIVSLGKSWLDTLQALDLLGIDEVRASELGLRLYKIGAPWPLEPDGVNEFADGLETIVVVEEKRSLIETQIKEQLYGRASAPAVLGKRDEQEAILFPATGALDANRIAITLARRILSKIDDPALRHKLDDLEKARAASDLSASIAVRTPYFCAGCPHNTSTRIPDGSRASAGIGCHYMVLWMDRETKGFTQMGGEGANWIGEAPFSKRKHIFQNLGDGTYNHSGYLAVRAAAAAGVNITYKILYNDAVAMTGGQPNDGDLSVDGIARQMAAEGARKIAIVSDEPEKYGSGVQWPDLATFHHRSEMDQVQRDLAATEGLTILIYDQTCAAEKRRRRKRGTYPDPDKRVVINSLVCEGCGDCGEKSNCVAVQPLETEFGRKRTIDQSACNKDYSCLNGFCPSFVTVHGGEMKKGLPIDGSDLPEVPEPDLAPLDRVQSVLITGVGGTGVVTIGAILGMAAHLEGKGVGIIDMAGLAQKGGSVTTHMRIAPTPDDISSIRVGSGQADTILACDIVVAASQGVLGAMKPGISNVFVNTYESYPGDFTRNTDFTLPSAQMVKAITKRTGKDRAQFIEAQRFAKTLLGDAIAANMFLVGMAWQNGAIPLTREALLEAIKLNGVAVDFNIAAFEWGRHAAYDLSAVEALCKPEEDVSRRPMTIEETIERRTDILTRYQDEAYAARYRQRLDQIRKHERDIVKGRDELSKAVAHALFKLMAIKDEYEVARLYTDGSFHEQLSKTFENWDKIEFHLAPPMIARREPETGHLVKRTFGPWMMKAFGVLARLKRLRGTAFDIFGYSEERKWERQLLADYEATLDTILDELSPEKYDMLVSLASYPQKIRGFGHVKSEQAVAALAERDHMMDVITSDAWEPVAEAAE